MKALDILPTKDELREMLAASACVQRAARCDAATPQDDPGWFIRSIREQRTFHMTDDFIY